MDILTNGAKCFVFVGENGNFLPKTNDMPKKKMGNGKIKKLGGTDTAQR